MNNHERFLCHLEASKDAVWLVGRWLSSRGHDVQIDATKKAPSHADWKEYADNGDLYIVRRVEVKQLSYEFTCRLDWPFGSKFIVCAKHSFDRANPKPFMYVILNKSATHAAIVKSNSSHRWYVEQVSDSRYEGRAAQGSDRYMAPLDVVTFRSLDESARQEEANE